MAISFEGVKASFYAKTKDEQARSFYKVLVPILLFDVIVTVIACIMIYPNEDVSHYYYTISDLVDNHLMPYSDYVFEYPPFTLVVFLIPKLLSWDLDSFRFAFGIFAAVFYCIFAHFTIKITDRFNINRFYVMAFILAMILFSHEFAVARNDIFAVALVAVSMYLFLERRYVPSSVILAMAVMIKIYPIILIPVFMMILISRREWKESFIFLVVSGLVCLLMEVPFLINDPSTAFAYLTYHSDRGLQVEGVASSVLLLINIFTPVIDSISVNYGSSELAGSIPDAVAGCLDILQIAAMVAVLIWAAYRLYRYRGGDAFRSLAMISLLMIMAFITFSKVYSAQYMLWILALIPFIYIDHHKDTKFTKFVFVFGIMSLLSSAVAYSIGLHTDSAIPVIIVFLKNVVHVALMVYIIVLLRHVEPSGADTIITQ